MTATIKSLTEEKQTVNERLDSVINVTQKDRVESNLHRLEIESYVKQIEQLKVSETKLKRIINSLKTQLNDNFRIASESQDKYTKELENNRYLDESIKDQRFKFEDIALANSKLNSQLEEKSLNYSVLLNKVEKQKSQLEERNMIIDDLKQSVQLKITVADDLQHILKQSQE